MTRADGALVPVSGQVDRLAVTPDAILIADYKTDREPPRRIEDVPQTYVIQLALYRAVLTQLYPGRITRAALSGPRRRPSWKSRKPCWMRRFLNRV